MANNSAQMDAVLGTLADPTRREVVQRLGRGPASVGELAAGFPIALPSFLKHVRVLEASGLVHTRKRGRVRTCELDRAQLSVVSGWLDAQRRIWEARTDRLEAFALADLADDGSDKTSPDKENPR